MLWKWESNFYWTRMKIWSSVYMKERIGQLECMSTFTLRTLILEINLLKNISCWILTYLPIFICFRNFWLTNFVTQKCVLTSAVVSLSVITHLSPMIRLTWCLEMLVRDLALGAILLAPLPIALNWCKYFHCGLQ